MAYSTPQIDFPARPFLSCSDQELLIIDQSQMASLLTGGDVKPWSRLIVGPNNILESAPKRATVTSNTVVTIECESGATVQVDYYEGTARRLHDGKSAAYRRDLSEANDARGWMPLS